MSLFDSTKKELSVLLDEIVLGKLQLPDFRRGWVWNDEHIRALLVSIARSFPVGAVILPETGGHAQFQARAVEGVELPPRTKPEQLQRGRPFERLADVEVVVAPYGLLLLVRGLDGLLGLQVRGQAPLLEFGDSAWVLALPIPVAPQGRTTRPYSSRTSR